MRIYYTARISTRAGNNPKIKNYRLDCNLSQNKMAEIAEVDRKTLQNAESGKYVSELSAAAIARAVGKPMEELFDKIVITTI